MVERAATPTIPAWRRRAMALAKSITFPLVPDDYLGLLNPAWSARELTGRIERIKPETRDTSTVVIRPNFPWPGHRPGQYLRIGVELDGIRHWRAYSLTSDPDHPDGLVSITVKHVPEGRMSPYFTQRGRARLDGLPRRRRGRVPDARSAARAHAADQRRQRDHADLVHVARARAPRQARRRDPHPLRPRARSGDLRRGPATDERHLRGLHAARAPDRRRCPA